MNGTITRVSDQTFGLMPIECGWDNPNCLGGYSSILGSYDAANERQGSQWFYDIAPPMESVQPNYAAGYTASTEVSPPADVNPTPQIQTILPPTPTVQVAVQTPATIGTNAVAGSTDTINILGHEISKNVLIGGAVIIAAILLLKGDK